MKKLTIGITISANQSSNIWSSGHNQNIAFLIQCFLRSPIVEKVYLLNWGQEASLAGEMKFDGIPVQMLHPNSVTHEIDLVIEMGILMPDEWLGHIRALGAKVVTFIVGNLYTGNVQSMIFGRDGSLILNDPSLRDEIWTLPQYEKSCLPMLRTWLRIPALCMPHLWSPFFIEKQMQESRIEGKPFAFDSGRARSEKRGWRVAIFEPNISVTKCCFIPMLVCDHAYRSDKKSISYMMVMNSVHMKTHHTFFRFASNLDLTKDQKATYEPRVVFSDCMAHNSMDAVVSHHWENEQNYLYYDALHGGYPLIHNSDFLQKAGVGIYYPEFSAKKGGDALLEAWQQPPEYWQDYKQTAARFLQTLHPEHPENIRIFTEKLMHVSNAK